MVPSVFYGLSKDAIVHKLKNVFLELVFSAVLAWHSAQYKASSNYFVQLQPISFLRFQAML